MAHQENLVYLVNLVPPVNLVKRELLVIAVRLGRKENKVKEVLMD